ncbi:MAG: hypothetical protein ACYCSS_02800 [Sulfuriferula sp.]
MSHTNIPGRKSRLIMVGNVAIGGDAPISVQTMTKGLLMNNLDLR